MANCSGTYSGGKTKWYSCHQVWTQCRFFQSRTAPNCHGVSKRSWCMIDFSRPIRPHTSTSRRHVGFTCRHSPSYPHEIILKAYFASDAMLLCVLKKEHPCSVLDKFSRSCQQLPQFQPWSIMFHTCLHCKDLPANDICDWMKQLQLQLTYFIHVLPWWFQLKSLLICTHILSLSM